MELNAAVLPMLISAIRSEITALTRIEYIGNAVGSCTREIYALPGTPLSRAKDHNNREAVAMIPIAAAIKIIRRTHVIPVAAALL